MVGAALPGTGLPSGQKRERFLERGLKNQASESVRGNEQVTKQKLQPFPLKQCSGGPGMEIGGRT